MNKEFIPYEQALALKELGFDEPCVSSYSKQGQLSDLADCYTISNYKEQLFYLAPLYQQAFKWFREKYGLVIVIKPISDIKLELGYNLTKNGLIMKACTTYEEAELACLIKLIEIVKNK